MNMQRLLPKATSNSPKTTSKYCSGKIIKREFLTIIQTYIPLQNEVLASLLHYNNLADITNKMNGRHFILSRNVAQKL